MAEQNTDLRMNVCEATIIVARPVSTCLFAYRNPVAVGRVLYLAAIKAVRVLDVARLSVSCSHFVSPDWRGLFRRFYTYITSVFGSCQPGKQNNGFRTAPPSGQSPCRHAPKAGIEGTPLQALVQDQAMAGTALVNPGA